MKILVTATSFKPDNPTPALQKLQQFADEVVYNPVGRPLTEDELIPLLQGCDGYIAGLDFVTEKVIQSCDRLKVISRYGAGVDRVDLKAAARCGITVCNTPGANAQAVADLALGLMLSAARKLPMLNEKTRGGQWVRSTGMELYGKTLGILGLGAIGKSVAKRGQGFDMRVLAYDPYLNEEYAAQHNIQTASFEQVIANSDVISLHLPLTEETRHIISREVMEKMKPGVILVNSARGGLIDEVAAYDLLKSGHLGGLGLDAYEQEPPTASPLFELDNVVCTPHTGSHTREATDAMALMSVKNLIQVLQGNFCPYALSIG